MKSVEDCPLKRYIPGSVVCRNACEAFGTCQVGRKAKFRKPAPVYHSRGFYGVRKPK